MAKHCFDRAHLYANACSARVRDVYDNEYLYVYKLTQKQRVSNLWL